MRLAEDVQALVGQLEVDDFDMILCPRRPFDDVDGTLAVAFKAVDVVLRAVEVVEGGEKERGRRRATSVVTGGNGALNTYSYCSHQPSTYSRSTTYTIFILINQGHLPSNPVFSNVDLAGVTATGWAQGQALAGRVTRKSRQDTVSTHHGHHRIKPVEMSAFTGVLL